MRRGLASLIIGLSLIVATASWGSFTLSRTVLDPSRSERLADELLENPHVRQALVVRLTEALEAQIPPEIPVRRQLLEAGAERAIDDARVEALLRDGFVRVHQNALAGSSEPVVIDAGALGAVGREILVEARPELETYLPATPALEFELPTAGLAWVGGVKNAVDRFTILGALGALAGATVAFAVAVNRASVLRRVAFWGYGAAAFWILVGYGIPWLAGILSPTSAAIATAVVDVFFGAMIEPAIALVAVATVVLAIGFTLPTLQRRQAGVTLQPRGVGPTAVTPPVRATPPSASATGRPPTARPTALTPTQTPTPTPTRTVMPSAPPTFQPIVDNSTETWQPVGSTEQTEQMPIPTTPRWREGEGYLDE